MRYSTDNMLVSLQRNLATALRAFGYAVRWQVTGEVEPETLGLAEPKGTVTLVPEFPDDPAFLVRPSIPNDGTAPRPEDIVIPAFTLRLPSAPLKVRRVGIGHKEFERQRGVYIEGFVYDAFQQRELLDFLTDWLDAADVYLPIWDYASDPADPPALDPVEVIRALPEKEEVTHEVAAIRYYLSVFATVSYVE